MWQIAQAHSAFAPTYVYRYDYATKALKWSGMGATHATELLAVFDVYRSKFGRLLAAGVDSRTARKVSDDVQRRWLAFANHGAPGPDWPQYTRDARGPHPGSASPRDVRSECRAAAGVGEFLPGGQLRQPTWANRRALRQRMWLR